MHEAVSAELIYLPGVSVADGEREASQKTPCPWFRWPCMQGGTGSQTQCPQGKGVACVCHSLITCRGCCIKAWYPGTVLGVTVEMY